MLTDWDGVEDPDIEFPGKTEDCNSASGPLLVKHEPRESFDPLREHTINMKVEAHPSPARKSFSESQPSHGYATQASKAVELGIHLEDFHKIFKEKYNIAESRFPGESPDWVKILQRNLYQAVTNSIM